MLPNQIKIGGLISLKDDYKDRLYRDFRASNRFDPATGFLISDKNVLLILQIGDQGLFIKLLDLKSKKIGMIWTDWLDCYNHIL